MTNEVVLVEDESDGPSDPYPIEEIELTTNADVVSGEWAMWIHDVVLEIDHTVADEHDRLTELENDVDKRLAELFERIASLESEIVKLQSRA